MSVEQYWSLTIDLPRRWLDALEAWLPELGFPSFEERDTERGVAAIVYASDPLPLERLQAELQRVAVRAGATADELRFRLAEVPQGWALEWTQHLEPVALTPTFTLYPRRPERAPGPGELFLEPAFAFGFGEHESTRLAARWLEAGCRAWPGAAVLDVGCGTGVLSLVASRCGAAAVLGIDISAAAVLAARRNAALNGIGRGIEFEHVPIEQVSSGFDLVVANIEARISCELAPRIVSRLRAGGTLGLAGFIRGQCDAVARCYAVEGLSLELLDSEGEWCLLVGKKK
jgi:ribosomal protein L11 methyltransferase